MTSLRQGIHFFFLQSWMSYRALFSWLDPLAYALIKIISPILQMIFFSLLAGYVYKTSDITPWIIGNAILLCSKNAVYGVGSVLKEERFMGTLRLIVAAPSNKFLLFAGRGFMHIFDAMVTVTVGLLVGALFFGFSLSLEVLPLFVLCLLVSLYSAMAIGQVISCVGMVTRDVHLLLNVSEYALLILTGASFPLERLPVFLQGVSNALPVTRGIAAARLLAATGPNPEVWSLLTIEFLIGTLYLVLGYQLLTYFENCARKKATLDIY
jgi:ABC-2 type transport system permease protein